jgi:dTDP-4-dehydrorhamnose reductase
MKVLITGANGFLGQHLCLYMHNNKYDVYAVSRGQSKIPNPEIPYFQLELAERQSVLSLVSTINPDIIIHTAAMSKPDECYHHPEICLLNNVTATAYLLDAAKVVGARFIYVSTDFIFGEGGPHSELSEPAPLNFYGETKLMAENLVKTSGLQQNIVRPVFIYGAHWEGLRPSFIQWVRQNLEAKRSIKVVIDQRRTPTFVLDICKGIALLLQTNSKDSFHFAGSDIITPYEMAVTVARVTGLNEGLIEPVTADVFPEIVKRAKDSGLLIDKAREILGYQPQPFVEGVKLSFGLKS